MYYLPAENIGEITELNGEPVETTLDEIVGNDGFYMEYENSEEYYPNICNANAFSINTQQGILIGGAHSPQRPK